MSADPVIFNRLVAQAVTPRLAERALGAVDALERPGPQLACRHLAKGRHVGIAFLCAPHGEAGLLCPGCAVRHVSGHGADDNFGCDECFRLVDPTAGESINAVTLGVAVRFVVRDGVQHRSVFDGVVVVGGVGLCGACRALLTAAADRYAEEGGEL